ncbi:MAG: hypothetical protein GY898_21100 [Proteobacteria bacterium]|nr:hypothetical protein [Pseudomonadota bacterium]
MHAALGTDYGLNNELSAAAMQEAYGDFGLTYAGLRFQDARRGGAAADLGDLFAPAGDAGDYVPDMVLYFNPETNPAADPTVPTGLVGEHAAGSTYLFTGL